MPPLNPSSLRLLLPLGLLLSLPYLSLSSCYAGCNGHGTCNIFSQCSCHTGWQGAACEDRTCPFDSAWSDFATADDTAHALAECSNRGRCDRSTGGCVCQEGFVGKACQRTACLTACSERGRCVSLNEKASTTRDSNSLQFAYETTWDADKLYGCLCDDGFEGYDCSMATCPDGDDPKTTGQVNEVQLMKCTADPAAAASVRGTFALYYGGRVSSTVSVAATSGELEVAIESIMGVGDVTVTYSDGITTACTTATANVITVTFLENFGSLSPLVPYEDALYPDGSSIVIAADGTTTMTSSLGTIFTSVKGTKEAEVCAGRGTCDTTVGSCQCFTDNGDTFQSSDGQGNAGTRGDCGFAATSTAACPGETPCSGNGVCDSSTFKCSCAAGWTGGNCNQRTCPSGGSWFEYPEAAESAHKALSECSDMGICDTSTGTCECAAGYFGEACQYMACGGGTANPCSGHGTCLSMRHMSWESDNDGDATNFVYGVDPNNFATWDADRVFGCKCDDDWEGYDCGLRKCPYGDNPGTYNDAREVQLIKCQATGGTFQLQFRQQSTNVMPFDVQIGELERELEELTSINNVEISYSIDKITTSTNTSYLPNYHCGASATCLTDFVGTSVDTSTGVTLDACKAACDADATCFSFTFTASTGDCTLYDLNSNSTSKASVSTTAQSYYHTTDPLLIKGINNKGFCTNSTQENIVSVTFNNPSGDVPSIVTYTNTLTLVDSATNAAGTIVYATDGATLGSTAYNGQFTSVAGTTDREYCSGKGACNMEIGACTCHTGWGSSDGFGGMGALNDCGFRQDPIGGGGEEG